MDTQIGIGPDNLTDVAHALNSLLADEYILYTKTRNAHWNVEGPNFHSFHLFFEEQFNALDEIIDNVAERIRTLGHYAPATLKNFMELTHLSEQLHARNDGLGFIKELLNDHESIIMKYREKVNSFASGNKDAGTSDHITGVLETHEKMAWMLRVYLK